MYYFLMQFTDSLAFSEFNKRSSNRHFLLQQPTGSYIKVDCWDPPYIPCTTRKGFCLSSCKAWLWRQVYNLSELLVNIKLKVVVILPPLWLNCSMILQRQVLFIWYRYPPQEDLESPKDSLNAFLRNYTWFQDWNFIPSIPNPWIFVWKV